MKASDSDDSNLSGNTDFENSTVEEILKRSIDLADGISQLGGGFEQLQASFKSLKDDFVVFQTLISTFQQERKEARERHVSGPSSTT